MKTIGEILAGLRETSGLSQRDVAERLRRCDRGLWAQVREVLLENKAQRHLRGGEATRQKYLLKRGARNP